MTLNYTPGEWYIVKSYGNVWVEAPDGAICLIYGTLKGDNALLLRAAAEMYEALKEIAAIEYEYFAPTASERMRSAAEAAIAKVEGK